MGKPAARMGDTTAHGGTIVLGNPTLLIGKMPASTLGDMHVCPMCTGPVPHVGGPITLGSMGVLLGKKPGARISDLSVCVGPPSMPAVGCFTVLIGEAGSGSQAGSAAAAAAAAALTKKGPKAIEPFPLGEPPGPTESHEIQVEFTDSAGKPLSGVVYHIKDPDSQEILGASTMDGAAHHGGYGKKGSYELTVKTLKDVKWGKAESGLKDPIPFSAKADSFEEGTEAAVMIFEDCGGTRRMLETLQLKVEGEKISGEWKWKRSYLPPEGTGPQVEIPVYSFQVVSGGLIGVSGPLKLSDKLSVTVTDPEGTAKKQLEYEIQMANGELRTGILDDSGKVAIEGVPPGNYKVKLVNLKGKSESTGTAPPPPKPKPSYTGFGDVKEAERKQEQNQAEDQAEAERKIKVLRKGDRGTIIEELNIRLAGFGGSVPKDEFDSETERCVKQFQADWMKSSSPDGIVDLVVAKALDEFSTKHALKFDALKCDCGKCGGFGKGQFKGEYNNNTKVESRHKYEYPGFHRSLAWGFKGALFYLEKESLKLRAISCGYRCWINNQNHKRTSTNHMGKAIDFTLDTTVAGVVKAGGKTECNNARSLIVSKLHAQIRWASRDKFSLEPGDPISKGEFVSPTWVHMDVREFDSKYLADKFFSKSLDGINGRSMQELFDSWEKVS